MSADVMVIAEHLNGSFTDATFEALSVARSLASQTGGSVEATVVGGTAADIAPALGGADRIVVVEDASPAFDPSAHSAIHADLVGSRQPQIVLVPYTSVGMDVASHIATTCDLPLVSYCQSIDAADGLTATCQLYAGKIEADVSVEGDRAVFALLSGAASADDGRSGGNAEVEVASGSGPGGTRFIELTEPEGGDVDITTQDVLVVVGRGIESEDNIEEAAALAEALGGAVAASRPIIDQGWLAKSRQVGKSGLTVTPKVYLALGVSGAPEHIEGMREASTIIAVNTDPQAPIFGVAHHGWVGDLFDLMPELTDLLDG